MKTAITILRRTNIVLGVIDLYAGAMFGNWVLLGLGLFFIAFAMWGCPFLSEILGVK